MQVINPLTPKLASETVPGELFVTSFGSGYALTVLLRRLDQGRSLFGILGGPSFPVPEIYATEYSGPCLSYGTDWVLETRPGQESFPQNHFQQDTKASLFLDNAAVVLRLKLAAHQREQLVSIDLKTFGDHQLSANAAPVYDWRVWQSEDDRIRVGAKPIFEVTK